jgi:SAM-dependent methyltransferase
MDAARLEFDDESFDNVICVEGAALFDTRERFLHEALRVLRNGGHLLMADALLSPASPLQPPANYVASEDEYRALWEEAGFAEVDVVDATDECWGGFADNLAIYLDESLRTGRVAWPVYRSVMWWLRRSNVERCLLASGRKL